MSRMIAVLGVQALASGTAFQLVRRVDTSPRDVIVLAPNATAADLSAAIHSLVIARQAGGDTAIISGVVRVRKEDRQSRSIPWAARVLNDLKSAPARKIAGIGTLPAVQIWLPPQQRPVA